MILIALVERQYRDEPFIQESMVVSAKFPFCEQMVRFFFFFRALQTFFKVAMTLVEVLAALGAMVYDRQ